MGHRSTDAVPLVSLVSEHAEVGIHHVVYHLISGRHVETIAEPIDAHLSGHHGIEHEVLQVLQGLWIGEECFVHVSTIHGLRCCAHFVCHLANWLPRPTSLYHLAGKCLHTASHSNCSSSPTFWSGNCDSTIDIISSISCSLAINISSMGLGTKVLVLLFMLILINPRTYRRTIVEHFALILHGVLVPNACDLPCVALLPMVSIDQEKVTHHAVQLLALKKKNPVNMYTIHANGTNGGLSGQFNKCHHTHWLLV